MSLLQNLLTRFSRKKSEEGVEGASVSTAETSAAESVAKSGSNGSVDSTVKSGSGATTISNSTPVVPGQSGSYDAEMLASNVVNIYSHGFTNGVYRVEPDAAAFERFLQYCNESDKIREQRMLNKLALVRVQERLDGERVACTADQDTVISKGKEAERLSVSMEELTGIRRSMEEKEESLVKQQGDTVPEYAWVPAIFFLLAGGTFIAADVSITKQITSWGFNMTGMQGWVYAVGLAFTAFLIKPVIDRMLEKPYQSGGFNLKTLYKIVLVGTTVSGLVMLWFLGCFRADSERAGMELKGLTDRMAGMDPTTADYVKLQTQYDGVQRGLDENTMGQNGLVLSGLLFAIGGALCLTVAFGSLKQLINRYWILPARIGRVRRKIHKMAKQLDAMRAVHTLVLADREKAEKRLGESELAGLREELIKLQDEELTLVTSFYQVQSERELALYRDGRGRGEKFQLDGDLLYRIPGNDVARLQLENSNGATGVSESQRRYARRPFVKMRKMIADQFYKNKNNLPYDDGTESDITG